MTDERNVPWMRAWRRIRLRAEASAAAAQLVRYCPSMNAVGNSSSMPAAAAAAIGPAQDDCRVI